MSIGQGWTGVGGFAPPAPPAAKKKPNSGLSFIGKALSILDLPRAAVIATGRQIADVLTGEGFSGKEWSTQVAKREGIGDLLKNANLPGGINTKRALGFIGDVVTDPLTYVTAGVGGGVREAALGGTKAASKVTAEAAARELAATGATDAAERVLARRSVNALTAEEAKSIGVRQGPTILRRVGIPGGEAVARTVSDIAAPVVERLQGLRATIPIGQGLTFDASKGLTRVQALQLKDAEQVNRMLLKGAAQQTSKATQEVLKTAGDKAGQANLVRAALIGAPEGAALRQVLDDAAAKVGQISGAPVRTIDAWAADQIKRGITSAEEVAKTQAETPGKVIDTYLADISAEGRKRGVANQLTKDVQPEAIDSVLTPTPVQPEAIDSVVTPTPEPAMVGATPTEPVTVPGPKPTTLPKPTDAAVAKLDQLGSDIVPAQKIINDTHAAAQTMLDYSKKIMDMEKRMPALEKVIAEKAGSDQARIAKVALDVAQRSRDNLLNEIRSVQARTQEILAPKLAESGAAPSLDHALVARTPSMLANEAAANAARVEEIMAKGATDAKTAAELAKRQQAEQFYSSAAAVAKENPTLSQSAAFEAQALKMEADLGLADDAIGKIKEVATDPNLLDSATTSAMDSLRTLASGRETEPWVADAVTRLNRVLKPAEVGQWIKTYDKVSGWWRAAALASPGFHARNLLGGVFNNAVAGMDPRAYGLYRTALKEFKAGGIDAIKDIKVRKAWEEAMKLGQLEGENVADIATKIGEVAPGGRIIGRQNPLFKTNMKIGSVVEQNLRMPLFIDTYLKTGDAKAALDAVMQYHFDYEDLSRVEREGMRRLTSFWTWTSRNLPLQLLNIADQPGKYTLYTKLKRNVELGGQEDPLLPDYFKKLLAIRLPTGMPGLGGRYLTPDLPFISAGEIASPRGTLNTLNPLLKVPLESITGQNLFQNRAFSATLTPIPSVWKPIAYALLPLQGRFGIPKVWRAKDGTLMMNEKDASKMENLLPILGRLRRLAPSETKYQDRALQTWLSFALGVSTRQLDPATKGGEMLRRKSAQAAEDKISAALEGGQKLANYQTRAATLKKIAAAQGGTVAKSTGSLTAKPAKVPTKLSPVRSTLKKLEGVK